MFYAVLLLWFVSVMACAGSTPSQDDNNKNTSLMLPSNGKNNISVGTCNIVNNYYNYYGGEKGGQIWEII